jgi:hypothetical protein
MHNMDTFLFNMVISVTTAELRDKKWNSLLYLQGEHPRFIVTNTLQRLAYASLPVSVGTVDFPITAACHFIIGSRKRWRTRKEGKKKIGQRHR